MIPGAAMLTSGTALKAKAATLAARMNLFNVGLSVRVVGSKIQGHESS